MAAVITMSPAMNAIAASKGFMAAHAFGAEHSALGAHHHVMPYKGPYPIPAPPPYPHNPNPHPYPGGTHLGHTANSLHPLSADHHITPGAYTPSGHHVVHTVVHGSHPSVHHIQSGTHIPSHGGLSIPHHSPVGSIHPPSHGGLPVPHHPPSHGLSHGGAPVPTHQPAHHTAGGVIPPPRPPTHGPTLNNRVIHPNVQYTWPKGVPIWYH